MPAIRAVLLFVVTLCPDHKHVALLPYLSRSFRVLSYFVQTKMTKAAVVAAVLLLLSMQQAVLCKQVTRIAISRHSPQANLAKGLGSNGGGSVDLLNYLDAQVRPEAACMGVKCRTAQQ